MKKLLLLLLLIPGLCLASEKKQAGAENEFEGTESSGPKECHIISCTTNKKPYAKMNTYLQCDCDFKNVTLNELYQKGYKLIEILDTPIPVYYLEKK
jgi:hypothetical protein